MPLIICPLIAIWNRSPLPSSGPHRSKGSRGFEDQEEATGFLQGIVSGLFGSKRQPSPLRAFVSLLLDLRDHMQVLPCLLPLPLPLIFLLLPMLLPLLLLLLLFLLLLLLLLLVPCELVLT